MLRQIVTLSESSFTLQFPKDMIGKTVEIIAFELKEANNTTIINEQEKKQRFKRIDEITRNSLVDLSNFKFNRDEANNYDE